ncbi:MAG: hypothetical protein AB8B53_00555 [Flavobacteriales bacterium]
MLGLKKPLKIQVEEGQSLRVEHSFKDDSPIFDLCDTNGKLLKSGKIDKKSKKLTIKNLNLGEYYLYILDGAQMFTGKFAV